MQGLAFKSRFLLESNLDNMTSLGRQTPDLIYSASAADKRYLQTQHNPLLRGQQEKDLSQPSAGITRMSQLRCKHSFAFRGDGPIPLQTG